MLGGNLHELLLHILGLFSTMKKGEMWMLLDSRGLSERHNSDTRCAAFENSAELLRATFQAIPGFSRYVQIHHKNDYNGFFLDLFEGMARERGRACIDSMSRKGDNRYSISMTRKDPITSHVMPISILPHLSLDYLIVVRPIAMRPQWPVSRQCPGSP